MRNSSNSSNKEKQEKAEKLVNHTQNARQLAQKLGLNPYPVNYWVVDHEEMAQLMAYDGFQDRYPHWRWGMKYYRQKLQDTFTGGHAFEIVINDNPAHAYLQQSNNVAEQKSVITHVEAHADFFKNNKAFRELADINATKQLSRHQDQIEEIIRQEDVSRKEVEEFIDSLLCIEDNIDQFDVDLADVHTQDLQQSDVSNEDRIRESLEESGFGSDMIEQIVDEATDLETETADELEEEYTDLMYVLMENGMMYDKESDKAVEMEDWQKSLIHIIRSESYYFAPQKMTKFMNEGWATYWQSMMMANENFAEDNEIVRHSELMSLVLGSSQQINPYKIGYNLWSHIENTLNREAVVEKLLQVEHITPDNFYETLSQDLLQHLEPSDYVQNPQKYSIDEITENIPETYLDLDAISEARQGTLSIEQNPWKIFTYEGLAYRNFSLIRSENRSFLMNVYQEEVEQLYRYLTSDEKTQYSTVTDALDDLDFTYAWDEMRSIREIYTDTTFIDRFLTEEFVDTYNYFAYEANYHENEMQVSSTNYEDVKKKLLLQLTNFGKPRVNVIDTNYKNEGRLLIEHQYNGINIDLAKARAVIERLHKLWGRTVHFRTVQKEVTDSGFNYEGIELYYDGSSVGQRKLDETEYKHLLEQTSYDTTPDDWFN